MTTRAATGIIRLYFQSRRYSARGCDSIMIDLPYVRTKLKTIVGADADTCLQDAVDSSGVGKKGIYSQDEMGKILDALLEQGNRQAFVARIVKVNLALEKIHRGSP